MIEAAAVYAIVGVVIILAIRSIRRTLSGKDGQHGCGTKGCLTSTCCNQLGASHENDEFDA